MQGGPDGLTYLTVLTRCILKTSKSGTYETEFTSWPYDLMNEASDIGSENSEFESRRGRNGFQIDQIFSKKIDCKVLYIIQFQVIIVIR